MMKATWSFVLYELRRHLPTLAVSSALLVVGPMVHRLSQGDWNYWDGEWNLAGATVALAFVPLLVLMMALSGWAGERSAGTLQWLYARPLSAARIFRTRVAAILGATTAWTVVALLVNGIFHRETLSELFQGLHLGAADPGLLWLVLIGWMLGGGVMASTLFSRSVNAFLGFVMTALVLGVLVPFFLLQICPTTWALLYSGREHGLLAAGHTYGSTMTLALLLAAWGAVRRAPGDRRRLSRAWKAATGVAVLGVLATLVVMLQPLRVDSSQLQGVRWLGDGTTLECARAPGIAPRHCHPVVHGRDGAERPLRWSLTAPEWIFAHPGRGVAVIDQLPIVPPWGRYSGSWLFVDRRGEQRYLALPHGEQPIGWSHRGSYFAWRMLSRVTEPGDLVVSGLMLLDEDLKIRRQPVEAPSADWTAVWIDDRRLLLTPRTGFAVQPRQRGWWMVISADGEIEVDPQPLPEGTALFPPASAYSSARLIARGNDLIARGNELVLLLSNGRDDTHLAKLDLGNGELRLGAAVSSAGSLSSLGTLADGSAVWAEYVFMATGQPDPGTSRIMTMPPAPAEEPREICRHFGLFGSYRGTTGSWALWEGMPGSRLYACHLGTGAVRVLDDLGPLGTRSAEVVEGGVLTIRGTIPLE